MYKPLPKGITIRSSSIEGLGLFATENISAGTHIGISHIAHSGFDNGYIRTPLGGFGNHSDTPNCFKVHKMHNMISTLWVVAEEDIQAGEEITWKYTLYRINNEE